MEIQGIRESIKVHHKEEKVNFARALISDKISSEDEKEHEIVKQYFEHKIPSFRDINFQKLVNVIDATYVKKYLETIKRTNVKKRKWYLIQQKGTLPWL